MEMTWGNCVEVARKRMADYFDGWSLGDLYEEFNALGYEEDSDFDDLVDYMMYSVRESEFISYWISDTFWERIVDIFHIGEKLSDKEIVDLKNAINTMPEENKDGAEYYIAKGDFVTAFKVFCDAIESRYLDTWVSENMEKYREEIINNGNEYEDEGYDEGFDEALEIRHKRRLYY